jgi:hypothetical protein
LRQDTVAAARSATVDQQRRGRIAGVGDRQFTPKGQMRWLDEPVTKPGTGPGRFAEYLIDLLPAKYRSLPIANAWGDPNAFYGADRQAGELSFKEILNKAISV